MDAPCSPPTRLVRLRNIYLCGTGKVFSKVRPGRGLARSVTAMPKEVAIWARMYYVFMFNWQLFSEHHRRRSNVEYAGSTKNGLCDSAPRETTIEPTLRSGAFRYKARLRP